MPTHPRIHAAQSSVKPVTCCTYVCAHAASNMRLPCGMMQCIKSKRKVYSARRQLGCWRCRPSPVTWPSPSAWPTTLFSLAQCVAQPGPMRWPAWTAQVTSHAASCVVVPPPPMSATSGNEKLCCPWDANHQCPGHNGAVAWRSRATPHAGHMNVTSPTVVQQGSGATQGTHNGGVLCAHPYHEPPTFHHLPTHTQSQGLVTSLCPKRCHKVATGNTLWDILWKHNRTAYLSSLEKSDLSRG